MCSNVAVEAYTGDSIAVKLNDVAVSDVIHEIGVTELIEGLILKLGDKELIDRVIEHANN